MKYLKNDMNEEWHHLDAKGRVLGRLASEAARLLTGKHRPDWADNKAPSVYVVITNVDKVVLTGKKERQKIYRRYSGYPGGLKERTAGEQRKRDPRRLVEEAISGMLPKNSWRGQRLRQLKLYQGDQHPHRAQVNDSK